MRLPFVRGADQGMLGIDCGGPDELSLVHISQNGQNGLKLLSSGRISLNGNDPKTDLADFVQKHTGPKVPAVGVMPLQSYSLMQVEAPDVPEEEMRQAVQWKVKDLIDYSLDEAVIDAFPTPQSPGRGKMVYVVSAHMDAVRTHIDLLQGVRIKLKAIDIPELALRNVAALTPEARKGICLVYLGQKTGLIVIVKEHILYVARNLKHGAVDLNRAASEKSDYDLLDTESPYQVLLESMVLDVQRTLDYYESTFGMASIGRVMVTADDAPPSGLMEHLQNNLGTEVTSLDVSDLFAGPRGNDAAQGLTILALGAALSQGGRDL